MVVVLVLVMEVDGVGDGIVGEGMGGSGSGWGQGGGGASWEVQDVPGNDLNIVVLCTNLLIQGERQIGADLVLRLLI